MTHTRELLPPDQEEVLKMTFRSTMLRCADIIDRITADDVLDAQAAMLHDGATLETVARCDRAHLASAHIRACVKVHDEKIAKAMERKA